MRTTVPPARAVLLAVCMTALGVPALAAGSPAGAAADGGPAALGVWSAPFEEPGPTCTDDGEGGQQCKPAAGSVVTLPNGKVVYWDALDSMEDTELNAVAEFGTKARNDLVRVLDLRGAQPTWTASDPDPASNPEGREGEYLPGGLYNDDETRNDGDLFCSVQLLLADGTVLDVGGTQYYQEPGVPGQPTYGVVELEGLTNSRLYDPESNGWSASGEMSYGRWYPSTVTLADGRVLVLSGVTKLLKPVYPERPADSGRNVTQSEVYDPATGEWTVDGGSRSLPLYPRVHLLPNGRVYYNAGGQTFNPAGQAYDEALWNTAAVYDPATRQWRDLGLPAFGTGLAGFRGSAFSQMLPLQPDGDGEYRTARFLSAGGVYGVSPGTYVGTDTSTLSTVTLGEDGTESFASESAGPLNAPRWYSTGVSLPTGQVLAFSGADRDEVVAPGSGTPVTTPEMFDPATGEWTPLAPAAKGRTYHNTAALQLDGRVLVGGHAPIATGYGRPTPELQALGLSNPYRDPSFELFSPPNLFYGPRPVITQVSPEVQRGSTLRITTPDAADVSSVTVVRNTALTHLVDADQRTVELPVVRRTANSVTVAVTDNAAVLPDGPYGLFVNKKYAQGETPSVGRQVFVGEVPERFVDDVNDQHNRTLAAELAARDAGSRSGDGGVLSAGAGEVAVAPLGRAVPVAASSPAGQALAATGAGSLPALAGVVLAGAGLLLWRRRQRV